MDIKEKIAVLRDGGHHVSVGLEEILAHLEQRIKALEPKEKGPDDKDELK